MGGYGRPGAVARVHLNTWRAAQKITFDQIIAIANTLHDQGAIILEHAYARPTGEAHDHPNPGQRP